MLAVDLKVFLRPLFLVSCTKEGSDNINIIGAQGSDNPILTGSFTKIKDNKTKDLIGNVFYSSFNFIFSLIFFNILLLQSHMYSNSIFTLSSKNCFFFTWASYIFPAFSARGRSRIFLCSSFACPSFCVPCQNAFSIVRGSWTFSFSCHVKDTRNLQLQP